MEVDGELLMERARSGYSTVTELADTLVRERGVSFKDAHAIVSSVVRLAESEGIGVVGISPGLVDRAAQDVIGEPLGLSEDLISRAIDPVRFVELRNLPGGPAPQEVTRMLGERRATHARATALRQERAQKVRERLRELDVVAKEWARRH
jgi:argininosuccinate lyase